MAVCPKCNAHNSENSKFCVKCGNNLQNTACPSCGTDVKPGAKFCTQCGHKFNQSGDNFHQEGFVRDGEWSKGEGEFVKRIRIKDMKQGFLKSFGGKSIKVPAGSICVVTENGTIKEVFPAGHQQMIGTLEGAIQGVANFVGSIFGFSSESTEEFFLIDKKPLPFITTASIRNGNSVQDWQVRMQAQIKTQPEALNIFLQSLVKDQDTLNAQAIHGLLKSRVIQEAQKALSQDMTVEQAEQSIKKHVEPMLAQYGMAFGVSLSLSGTTTSLDLHLGQNVIPDLVNCINSSCSAELPKVTKFCTTCGCAQPSRAEDQATGEQRPLTTKDGEHAELDIVLQFYGAGNLKPGINQIVDSISSVASRIISHVTYEELLSKEIFAKISDEAKTDIHKIAQTLGLRLTEITVLDVRSKSREWEMSTRADINRMKKELELNKEWLEVDGMKLDLEAEALKLVVQGAQMRSEHEFQMFRMEREQELKRLEYELEANRRQDEAVLNDQELRQDFRDRTSTLNIADAARASNEQIQVDQHQRTANRHMRDQDHIDRTAAFTQDTEFSRQQQNVAREDEVAQLNHEMHMENQTVDHDLGIQRRTMQFQSEANRLQTDDEDYAQRSQIERDLYQQGAQQNLRHGDQRFQQDLELEQLRAKQEMMMQAQQQQNEFAMAMEAKEQAHQQAILAQQAQMDASQLMATSGRQLTDAEAQAMASMANQDDKAAAQIAAAQAAEAERTRQMQQEMYERMMAENNASNNASQQRADMQQQQFMQMMQQMMSQQNQLQQSNMQAMAQANANTTQAYKEGAQQAQSMSERSMDTMSNVAASRATPGYAPQQGYPPQGYQQQPQGYQQPQQGYPPQGQSQQGYPPQGQPQGYQQQSQGYPPQGQPQNQQQPQVQQPAPQQPKSNIRACKGCGMSLTPDMNFCPECGQL